MINITEITERNNLMKIRILSAGIDYAGKECKHFLKDYTDALFTDGDDYDHSITVLCDDTLPCSAWALNGDGKTLTVTGGSRSAALCGMYDALRAGGLCFHADGSFLAHPFDFDAMFSAKKTVHPKVNRRGIRQHINFPMDISSYTLSEAQEYIRNLARMRFNAITFHSYGGQWHPTEPGKNYAGHFFYGQEHRVPENRPYTPLIHNRKYYCIPEIEPFFEDEKARSEHAMQWLAELIKTAKEVYMEVTFSTEIGKTEDDSAAMLRNICESYPLIDNLELFSGENFCLNESIPEEELVTLLGEEVRNADGSIPALGKQGAPITGEYLYCAEFLSWVKKALAVRDAWTSGLAHVPALRVGIYHTTNTDLLTILNRVMRRVLPADVKYSFLSGHGSGAVADNIEAMEMQDADFRNTMVYSWAEFDGNMYLQQLDVNGIYKLAKRIPEDSYGVCVNHWRTAENVLALSYTAEALIAPVKPDRFFLHVTDVLRINPFSAELFTQAAELTDFNRRWLCNIGFCFVGCWLAVEGINYFAYYRNADIEHAISEYEFMHHWFSEILKVEKDCTEAGKTLLRLWISGCECSALHLYAIRRLLRIRHDPRHPQKLCEAFDDSPEAIRAAFAEAAALAEEYAKCYAGSIVDRGMEGHIVSYMESMTVYLKKKEEELLEKKAAAAEETFDAPPVPNV